MCGVREMERESGSCKIIVLIKGYEEKKDIYSIFEVKRMIYSN